ncbi:MAG TPA: histidine phosphatase family protein [Candidatus Limnocylindria bacterium]|nr:histidine phosphatase family protein [Candidatus Limnocylindria bacterium]
MAILEIRRHAERAGPTHAGSALSPAGRAMAERLGRKAPAYAVVAASPLPRAKETAELIGGRLDSADPALLPDLSQLGLAGSIEEYAALLDEERERALADEQTGAWARIAAAAGDGHALVITHGGVIELAASRIARALGTPLRGSSFSYCEGVRIRYERGRPAALEVLRT